MLRKYVLTLLVVILGVTAICSSLTFATRSRVRAGTVVEETWGVDFTLGAGGSEYYIVSNEVKESLEKGTSFSGTGAVRVLSSTITIEPKSVSWKTGDTRHTAPGGRLVALIKWEASSTAADGATGEIHINKFPKMQGILNPSVVFHDGTEQVREVAVYQSALRMTLAQLLLSLRVTLPLAVVLHGLWWSIFELRRESRTRREALTPADNRTLPRTFHPPPIAEWTGWMITLFIFATVGTVMAGFTIAFGAVKPGIDWFIVGIMGAALLIGLLVAALVRASMVTVRLDESGISFSRGRGEPQWATAKWADLKEVSERTKTYKGNVTRWLEATFPNGKKYRASNVILDYVTLKEMAFALYLQNKRG